MAAALLLAYPATAYDVLDPTGAIYTDVSASSQFSAAYAATNLFDKDVGSVTVGQTFSAGAEFAKAGSGDVWVAFQVDQPYAIGSVFFSQRSGSTIGDNMQRLSIWASPSGPFTAANPGTAPNTVVSLLPNVGSPTWVEYLLTNALNGQYFLLHLEQTTVGGNPGGSEMRLGLMPPATPPTISQQPVNRSLYPMGSAHFTVSVAGSIPFAYQWYEGTTALANGGKISGANTATLTISNLAAGDAGSYACAITNSFGSTNSDAANLTILPFPTTPVAMAMMSNSPVAFWQLNESTVSQPAVDLAGGYDGTYGGSSGVGFLGPQAPAFPGFPAGNTALETFEFTVDSAVTAPPLNLGAGGNVTMVAWVYADGSIGAQNPYAAMVFCRGYGNASGLICSSDGTQLAYQWGGLEFNFNSGLLLPTNQWCMVALAITPNNATLYLGVSNVVVYAVDNYKQTVQNFLGATYLGLDPDIGESARTFNGAVDDVAVYNSTLSLNQIQAIYSAAIGSALPAKITVQPGLTNQLFLYEPLSLKAAAAGSSPISYQWYKDNLPLAGATNNTYAVADATVGDSGNYYLIVTNSGGADTSMVAQVTVSTNVLRVLSPKGAAYQNVAASSVFAAGWGPTNLFSTDVTGLPLGATMTTEGSGHEWAKKGSGDAWVVFNVDQIYTIGAVYWSQRQGSGTGDNMQVLSIWSSATTPFAAADPGTPPSDVISLTPNSGNPVWLRYLLTNALTGQYFLLHAEQTTVTGNPGGSEMRLGVIGVPGPLNISAADGLPVLNWSTVGNLLQSGSVNGPWVSATGITNGLPAPGTASQQFFRLQYYP